MAAKETVPSVADEMAKFSGFTTNNGETVKSDTTIEGPGGRNLSEEERAAGIKIVGGEAPRGKEAPKAGDKGAEKAAAPAKITLTDDESTAALDAARAAAGLTDDQELTKEEEDEALLAALATKKEAAKPPVNDRVKRAQEGRRRAEARAASAERKTSDLERRLAALEAGGVKVPLTGDTKKANDADATKEPDPKDFEFGEVDAKFIRALARWEAKQEIAEASKKTQTQTRAADEAVAQAEFTEKKAAFEDAGLEAFDDFQEVVIDTVNLPESDPAYWPLSATVGQLLLESDHGPAIARQLASDTKEAKRVNKLSAPQQAAWFGRQEAKLESQKDASGQNKDKPEGADRAGREAPKETPRTVSRAPIPLNRGRGTGGNKQPSDATTDFAAFEAMANQPAQR